MGAPKGHAPYNKNGEGGRPKIWTDERLDLEADALEKWILDKKENIFIQRFCLERKLPERELHLWINRHKRFSDAYNDLKTKQKVCLFEGGLTKKFAHPMCALLLSNYHDMFIKTEQKITSENTHTFGGIMELIDGQTKDLINE